MTILYQCDEYPPARNGGIGTVVKLVAEAMALRGHKVIVAGDYSNQNQYFEKTSEVNGVRIIRFQKFDFRTVRLKFLKSILFLLRKIKLQHLVEEISFEITRAKQVHLENLMQKLIDAEKVDVLELVDYQDFLFHSPKGKMKYKKFTVPAIMRVHGSVSFLSHFLQGKIEGNVLENDKAHFQRVDAVSAVSHFSADFVKNHILDLPVDVIYNPIEKSIFYSTEKYPEANIVLFFGKIVESKGAFSLIKAFNLVAKVNQEVQLVLIGNGEIDKAKQLIHNELKERVVFKSFMSKDELMKEIDKAYLCVLPSYFENFSMAALEVLARGRALIYTERSSGPELIQDGVNGWLVNPDDVQQIADKITFALNNPDITKLVAENGQTRCKARFSTDVIIPELEKYYSKQIYEFKKNC